MQREGFCGDFYGSSDMKENVMTIRKLDTHEVRDVYRKYLRNDFPRNERRPLWNIMNMRRQKQYICYGVFCENRLVCYVFFVTLTVGSRNCCLLDYFAVMPELRGSGIGSWFITQFEKYIQHMDLVIVETENPDKAKNCAERAVMESRLSFYLRNGLRDTGVMVETFGVPYRILELPLAGKKSEVTQEEVRSVYEAFYHVLMTERMFQKYICFPE